MPAIYGPTNPFIIFIFFRKKGMFAGKYLEGAKTDSCTPILFFIRGLRSVAAGPANTGLPLTYGEKRTESFFCLFL